MKKRRMVMIEPGWHTVKQVHGDLFIVTGGDAQGKLFIIHSKHYWMSMDYEDLEQRVLANVAPRVQSTPPSG